jgi:hypothetical protein
MSLEVGKYSIITGFNNKKNKGIYKAHKTPITLQ